MPKNQLSGEDKVVIFFSLLGLIGSVVLYYFKFPSLMVSIFLSSGITSLVYRFLGGIQGAKFVVGALTLGGSIAALIGLAYWMDSTKQLAPRQEFRVASNDIMVGSWDWKSVGPSTGWDGYLSFTQSGGQLSFTGEEFSLVAVPGKDPITKRILEMTNGKAVLSKDGTNLSLDSEVHEFQYDRRFRWKSEVPLVVIPAFVGQLRPYETDDLGLKYQPWGILITKEVPH
jgi:hypothetical protein